MKRTSLALATLLLASGAASAQTTVVLPSVQVRPDNGAGLMTFSCSHRDSPKPIDVEALLAIKDRTQTQALTKKLLDAVAEACAANASAILIERGKAGGSLKWHPIAFYDDVPAFVGPAPVYYGTVPMYVAPDGAVVAPDGTVVKPAPVH